jgi:S1-C subfamily serine protease
VLFDPEIDAAVLRVDGLDAPALRLLPTEVDRGAGGTVLGFPGGRYLEMPAGVRRLLEAVGRDIYSREEVPRRVYELQAKVRHGNSGGPFVLAGGVAAGLVFGASLSHPNLGYAIASPRLIPLVERAEAHVDPVGTGRCVR